MICLQRHNVHASSDTNLSPFIRTLQYSYPERDEIEFVSHVSSKHFLILYSPLCIHLPSCLLLHLHHEAGPEYYKSYLITALSLSEHVVCFVWRKESTRHKRGSCGCLRLSSQHSQNSLMHRHYRLYPCHKSLANFGFFPCSVNSVSGKIACDTSGRSSAPFRTSGFNAEEQHLKLSLHKQIRFQANDQPLTVTNVSHVCY